MNDPMQPRGFVGIDVSRLRPGVAVARTLTTEPPAAELVARLGIEPMSPSSAEAGVGTFPDHEVVRRLRARIHELETANHELAAAQRALAAELESYRRVSDRDRRPARPAVPGAARATDPSPSPERSAPGGTGFERVMSSIVRSRKLPLVDQLRDLIAGAVDAGTLGAGERLPSIRSIAERFGATPYRAMQAYAVLEAEGMVERRERSGIYVAAMDSPARTPLPETAEWLASVLTQACDHHLRIPQLPELIHRWTATAPVRCLCFDSCADTTAALVHELSARFGIEAAVASRDDLLRSRLVGRRPGALSTPVRDAHLLVTTAFHANEIRGLAEPFGKPVLTATMNPEVVDAVERHLASRELVVICTSSVFGERIRALHGGRYRDRIRPVLADRVDQEGVDLTQPVLVTHAARQQLGDRRLRLVAPPFPFFSLDFARKVATQLLRLNLEAARG